MYHGATVVPEEEYGSHRRAHWGGREGKRRERIGKEGANRGKEELVKGEIGLLTQKRKWRKEAVKRKGMQLDGV